MCVACALAASLWDSPASADPFPAEATPFPLRRGGTPDVTLTWTGVAGLVLEAEGTRIAFDPFVTRPGVLATLLARAEPDRAAVERTFSGLEAVFVGHAHYDHAMDVSAVALASPRARIFGGRTAVALLERLGSAPGRLEAVEDASTAEVGPFRVEAVRAAHGVVPLARLVDRVGLPGRGVPRTPFRWPRGEVFGWRVEVRGRTLHVQGSAGIDDAALSRQGKADVLVACVAARKGTPRYLERLGERLRPAVLVPCHHDDFFRPLSEAPRPVATLRWGAFLREAAALERAFGTLLYLPARGRPVPL